MAAKAKKKRHGAGKPFKIGFDPRRNLKGPAPEVFELKEAIRRDGKAYIDQLFRLAMKGNATAVRVAIEQMLGRPPASIEVTGKDGGPIQVEDARAKLAERIANLAAAREAAAGDPKPQ